MGNFTRNTFNKLKHYVGVRLQQGVPILDADWNEMEDIRKHELQTFLKWFVGNGVPQGNDGFRIMPPPENEENDFIIKGGTEDQPGRCLVEGWDVIIEDDIKYTEQQLYNNDTLAQEWGVESLAPLSPPSSGERIDTVYLDVWEREVGAADDIDLVHPAIKIETCVRLKREWVVRVAQDATEPPAPPQGHVYYPLAEMRHASGQVTVEDLRRTGLAVLSEEITIKDGNVGIGTSSPGKKLEVAGDIKTSGSLIVGNEGQFGIKTTNGNAHMIPDDYLGNMHLISINGMVVIDSNHHKFRSAAGADWLTVLNGNVGIGTTEPQKNVHIQGESDAPLQNDTHDRPGLAITGHYPQLDLFSSANNTTHGPIIRIGSYNDDSKINFKHWNIGTSGRNSNFLDFGFYSGTSANPHYGIRNTKGKTVLTLKENGNVGIGTLEPGENLEVNGTIKISNVGHFGFYDGKPTITSETFGSLRLKAVREDVPQLVVANNSNIGIGTLEPKEKLDVDGSIRGKSFWNVSQSFFVGGDSDKFYAVVFHDKDWSEGPAELQVSRSNVHIDRSWWGSMNLTINWHAYWSGHAANFLEQRYNYSERTFVKDIIEYRWLPYLLIWLRGNTTYNLRSLNNRVVLYQILGTNNQTCSFDLLGYTAYSTAMDCTYRPEQADGIKVGTTIAGDFYAGNIYANNKLVPVGSSDYAEYFESKNGKEIKPGTSVVLEDAKIRSAKKNEIPIGVISASPGIVGGVHIEWPKKYLHDEFGNQIIEEYKEEIMVPKKEKVKKERQKMEKKKVTEKVKRTEVVKKKGKYYQVEIEETVEREIEEPVFKEVDLYDDVSKKKIGKHKVPIMETYEEEIDVLDEKGQPVMVGSGKFETKTRPKINPDYDEKKEYIPREKRPEWNCVGLLGQLPLRKGQPVAPTWIKIKDISKEVELWLVK